MRASSLRPTTRGTTMIATRVKPRGLRFLMSADYAGQWRMRSAAWLRIATVLLAIILVASVTKWALTFSARRTPAEPLRTLPAGQVEAKAPSVDSAAIARLLGASGSAGNIRALGVIAEGATGK